jgi:sugar phosphate permease
MIPALDRWQRRLVVVAWITYAAFYLGRVNLSTAIPSLQADLEFTKIQVGLFATGHFAMYAIGSLINGRLGDRLSPRRFVLAGLLASAGLNIVFGLSSLWVLLFVVWTANGYVQSMGWGPILRTLANWLDPAQRQRVSSVFGTSFVAGNAVTWLLTGWLVVTFGWRSAFFVPALLLVGFALSWFLQVRDTPQERVPDRDRVVRQPQPREESFTAGLVRSLRRYWLLALGAFFAGPLFIFLTLWTPTYFVEIGGLEIGRASSIAALLPLVGIGGILLTGFLTRRYLMNREVLALAWVLAAIAVLCAVFPLLPFQLLRSALVFFLLSALVYGATNLFLATMPLAVGAVEETSGVAGLLDFSFSIGGALSGVLIGAVLDTYSWTAAFLVLAATALVASLIVFRSRTP